MKNQMLLNNHSDERMKTDKGYASPSDSQISEIPNKIIETIKREESPKVKKFGALNSKN